MFVVEMNAALCHVSKERLEFCGGSRSGSNFSLSSFISPRVVALTDMPLHSNRNVEIYSASANPS